MAAEGYIDGFETGPVTLRRGKSKTSSGPPESGLELDMKCSIRAGTAMRRSARRAPDADPGGRSRRTAAASRYPGKARRPSKCLRPRAKA